MSDLTEWYEEYRRAKADGRPPPRLQLRKAPQKPAPEAERQTAPTEASLHAKRMNRRYVERQRYAAQDEADRLGRARRHAAAQYREGAERYVDQGTGEYYRKGPGGELTKETTHGIPIRKHVPGFGDVAPGYRGSVPPPPYNPADRG